MPISPSVPCGPTTRVPAFTSVLLPEQSRRDGRHHRFEVAEVKAKRTEIEKIDIELRKEFSGTEKKLKDAKLPKGILDRHYKFVKHYEDNLAELKANLEEVGKYAAGSKQEKEALKKANAHLDKTKPPTKHVPLDPNKLPHRTVKAKERTPRLKKEEFKKDFPPQRHKGTKTAREMRNADFGLRNVVAAGFSRREKAAGQKPFLVASNGSLAGLLPSYPELGAPKLVVGLPLSDFCALCGKCSYPEL